MAGWSAALVSFFVWAMKQAVGTATEKGELQCSAEDQQLGHCSSSALAREHQLLQFGGGKLRVAQNESADEMIPGEFDCRGMRDIKRVCSANQCKVLATNMRHKTCSQYCAANGRTCVWAAEEHHDTCEVKALMLCDQTWRTTSDLLCECSVNSAGTGGQAPPTAKDPSQLQLVWADDFNGNHVDTTKWSLIEGGGGFGNWELQYYTSRPHNAQVAGGTLKIVAKCESFGGHAFTSAKLETKHKGDWGPGHRVDVRARLPQGKGTWPAIWMLSTDNSYGGWPRSGEIDIMETVGCTHNKVYGTVHTEAYNHMLHTEKSNNVMTNIDAWHVYTIEWTFSRISWYIDGNLFHSFATDTNDYRKWPYNKEFYLILNVAVGGSWGGWCLHGRPSCQAGDEFGHEQVMEVDYARVYAL